MSAAHPAWAGTLAERGARVLLLSLTAQPAYQEPFAPLVPGVRVLPFGDFDAALEGIDGEVALVLVEPIQGEGGVGPAPPGWLAHLRRCCDARGALLVFDEVQCGVGRTGTFYAFQGEGVVPDALVSAKGLAGGLPMAALLARGEAATAFAPGDHGCTFGGGLLVAAAAHAVLDVVLGEGFLAEVAAKGEHLRSGLERLVAGSPAAATARGRGLMQGLVLVEPRAADLVRALLDLGVLTCPAGPDVVRLVPPLIISRAELDEGLEAIERALAGPGGAPGGRR